MKTLHTNPKIPVIVKYTDDGQVASVDLCGHEIGKFLPREVVEELEDKWAFSSQRCFPTPESYSQHMDKVADRDGKFKRGSIA